MHELPVTQGILQVAIESAQQNDASRITDIYLVIGALSGLVDDSIQFYFDFLSRDTLAAGATLHIRREPALADCWQCGQQSEVTPPLLTECPACGSPRLTISGGRAFYVESIDIDEVISGT